MLRSTNRISFLSWPVNAYSIRCFHVKLYTLSITLSYFRLNTWAGSICYCPYWWKLADLNSPQYLHFLSVLWVHLVSIWCMYYTIFCCFCQEVLKNFFGGYLISIGRNKTQTKNRYKLAYLSCLLKKEVEVTKSFLVVRTLICFQKASLLFPDFQTMSTNHNGWWSILDLNQWLHTFYRYNYHSRGRLKPLAQCFI